MSSRFGNARTRAFVVVAIDLQPVRRVLMAGEFLRLLQDRQLLAAFANRDLFAHAHLVRRNVHLASIHVDVAVTHQLASLAAGHAEAKAVNHVVQTALQLLQQHFAGDALVRAAFSK